MKHQLVKTLVLMALCSASAVHGGPIYTAIQTPAGTVGNQQLAAFQTQTLGDDFNVNSSITVYSLGVFDSGGNGLYGTLVARIYDRNTQTSLASISFSGTDGTLVGGFRFINLATPLTLPAGFQGVISAAYLGSPLEPDGNVREAGTYPWTADTSGLIQFVGEGRHSFSGTGDAFPNVVDPSPSAINFSSASFTFSPVPEPSTFVLAGFGFMLLLKLHKMRFAYNHVA
jgi:hypothetical protein